MKSQVQPLSDEFLDSYPIKDLVEGWFFRVQEVSNGVYQVDGIDYWGRKVSRKGTDPDESLNLCVKDTQGLEV